MQDNSICHYCKKKIELHSKEEAVSCALKIIKTDLEADTESEDNRQT